MCLRLFFQNTSLLPLLKYILEEDTWENLSSLTSCMQPKGFKFLSLHLGNLKLPSGDLSLEAVFWFRKDFRMHGGKSDPCRSPSLIQQHSHLCSKNTLCILSDCIDQGDVNQQFSPICTQPPEQHLLFLRACNLSLSAVTWIQIVPQYYINQVQRASGTAKGGRYKK